MTQEDWAKGCSLPPGSGSSWWSTRLFPAGLPVLVWNDTESCVCVTCVLRMVYFPLVCRAADTSQEEWWPLHMPQKPPRVTPLVPTRSWWSSSAPPGKSWQCHCLFWSSWRIKSNPETQPVWCALNGLKGHGEKSLGEQDPKIIVMPETPVSVFTTEQKFYFKRNFKQKQAWGECNNSAKLLIGEGGCWVQILPVTKSEACVEVKAPLKEALHYFSTWHAALWVGGWLNGSHNNTLHCS